VQSSGSYAVVLASRPYQNDDLVNHGLAEMFTRQGIPVLTADSLPESNELDLSQSRIDIVNNYHARMLSSAIYAAQKEYLEYVQIVSFGCGHDAYLSDEIIRIMKEISGKTPLILKLDESDVQGPLRIRVRSFLETVSMRRKSGQRPDVHELTDAYPVKFVKKDKKRKGRADSKHLPCLQPHHVGSICRAGDSCRIAGIRQGGSDCSREKVCT
jgi:predicted nucleotide-binding protein (sugar kinase/HSP70/actin superfamily)